MIAVPDNLRSVVRVVAAGMQSQIDRHPHRGAPVATFQYLVSVDIWEGRFAGPVVYQVRFQGPHREPMTFVNLLYALDRGQWAIPTGHSPAGDPESREISQEEAEYVAATAYTFPFPVARVRDKAINLAAVAVREAERLLRR